MGASEGRPLRVFLSHAAELRRLPVDGSFIDAVERAVMRAGHLPVDMASWTAAPQPPAQVCREAVEGADVYLGVLGFRYGSPVREHPEMSYTELEFDTAQRAGKPLLVFLLDDRTHGSRELLTDLEHGRRQEAFRRRVEDAGITRASAASPDELATVVLQALHDLPLRAETAAASATGTGSRVWRVPPRNQVFTGRATVLERLRESLAAGEGGVSVIHALHGMGGIGKTSLALEYAHRHSTDYDLVWWVPAEDSGTIPSSLAECAQSLGLSGAGDAIGVAVARLQSYLHERDRWLLCYDNAEDPTALRPYLISGPGHVLITSRNPNWWGIADPIGLDVLDREDGAVLLQARAPALTDPDARRIAAALGHLPLALAQAGAFLAATALGADRYLDLLEQRAREVTARGKAEDYPDSLAAAWDLAFDRLAQESPAALQLLTISAYLAPEPIPFTLFTTQTELLPEPLAVAAGDPLGFTDLTGALRTRALARIDAETLQLHRLVQALLRDRDRPPAREGSTPRSDLGAVAAAQIGSGVPEDPWNAPETWPTCALLLPHVMAVTTSSYACADADQTSLLLSRGASFLRARGEPRSALPLVEQAHAAAEERHGAGHPATLGAAYQLAAVLTDVGEHERALSLDEDTLVHQRSVSGDDHPETLVLVSALAVDYERLGKHERARALHEDTLARRRRLLGDDHPDTLQSAFHLAATLASLGENDRARTLREDTLAGRRRVLGDDHPDTLRSARAVAYELGELGEHERAFALQEDTFVRRRRLLGDDHPDTLDSARALAWDLMQVGETERAAALLEDVLNRRRRVLGDDHPDTRVSADDHAAATRALEGG